MCTHACMQVLAHALYMTSSQAKLALSGFSSRTEQVRAATHMLPALEDPQHLKTVVNSLAPEAQEQVSVISCFS
jgi:Domain of unknown function (DUF4476)